MNNMTPKILKVAYTARENGDSKELFLNSVLMSYVDAKKDLKKDQVSLIFLGKRTIPKPIVRFYASGASLCPPKLYKDIEEYFRNAKKETVKALREGAHEILKELPEEDKEDIMRTANECQGKKDTILTLWTCLIFYAWRRDLASYTYSKS